MPPIPITIITGFLGSGKTTLILNLIPQLPRTYRLALLKNEFGDLAIDSQLASSQAISGVQELVNGCICCNLVGQLGEALETLKKDVNPDRIIIETSGSAFPATLAMEVNRISSETGNFVLDGVVAVIDVENWKGYDDTSYTAKLQARYTDLIVFNKWEIVDERCFDECLDRVGDLEVDVAWVKSDRGMVGKEVVLGVDGTLARELGQSNGEGEHEHGHETHGHKHGVHEHESGHQSEVEVLSVKLLPLGSGRAGIDLTKLKALITSAPKDEIYRIKAIFSSSSPPSDESIGLSIDTDSVEGYCDRYILNWAFGRYNFTPLSPTRASKSDWAQLPTPPESGKATPSTVEGEPLLRMTIVLARDEAGKWKKRIEEGDFISVERGRGPGMLTVERLL
jgi:G3E family GTPase